VIVSGNDLVSFTLNHLIDFNGLTKYAAVKSLSRRYKLPTSTLKYVINKLIISGLVSYDGVFRL